MTENARVCVVSCVGAAIGAVGAYLLFTDSGREVRRKFEPAIEDLARELGHFRGTIAKAAGVANESWKLLNEAIAETSTPAVRYSSPHQANPF